VSRHQRGLTLDPPHLRRKHSDRAPRLKRVDHDPGKDTGNDFPLEGPGGRPSGLLAGYAGRLWRFDAVAGTAGMITAAVARAPVVVTLVTALVADPAHRSTAGTWSAWEPRADDLLFLGITAFGAAIALRARFPSVARVLGAIVAVPCGVRLVLEATGQGEVRQPRADLIRVADGLPRPPQRPGSALYHRQSHSQGRGAGRRLWTIRRGSGRPLPMR
jgi:hypothetical protein